MRFVWFRCALRGLVGRLVGRLLHPCHLRGRPLLCLRGSLRGGNALSEDPPHLLRLLKHQRGVAQHVSRRGLQLLGGEAQAPTLGILA